MQNWERAQAVGKPTRCGNIAALHGATHNPANLPLARVADRAALSGASIRTQKTADKVARENPELAAQVGRGEISMLAHSLSLVALGDDFLELSGHGVEVEGNGSFGFGLDRVAVFASHLQRQHFSKERHKD